jgi:hypothetical protein
MFYNGDLRDGIKASDRESPMHDPVREILCSCNAACMVLLTCLPCHGTPSILALLPVALLQLMKLA